MIYLCIRVWYLHQKHLDGIILHDNLARSFSYLQLVWHTMASGRGIISPCRLILIKFLKKQHGVCICVRVHVCMWENLCANVLISLWFSQTFFSVQLFFLYSHSCLTCSWPDFLLQCSEWLNLGPHACQSLYHWTTFSCSSLSVFKNMLKILIYCILIQTENTKYINKCISETCTLLVVHF